MVAKGKSYIEVNIPVYIIFEGTTIVGIHSIDLNEDAFKYFVGNIGFGFNYSIPPIPYDYLVDYGDFAHDVIFEEISISYGYYSSISPLGLFIDKSGRVYYVFAGKKYWIANPFAFTSYGFKWQQVKKDLLGILRFLQQGYKLDGKAPLPGTIILDINTKKVYIRQGPFLF